MPLTRIQGPARAAPPDGGTCPSPSCRPGPPYLAKLPVNQRGAPHFNPVTPPSSCDPAIPSPRRGRSFPTIAPSRAGLHEPRGDASNCAGGDVCWHGFALRPAACGYKFWVGERLAIDPARLTAAAIPETRARAAWIRSSPTFRVNGEGATAVPQRVTVILPARAGRW
jgi:hypothetical protein